MLTWLTAEIQPAPLGISRTFVGAAAVLRALIALPVVVKLSDPSIVRLPYADWLPHPTKVLVLTLIASWIIFGLAFTLGWRVSITGPLLVGSIGMTLALDQQTYSNHLYLMAWLVLLMTLADAGASRAIGGSNRRVVRWPVLLILGQVSIVYGFSALTKLNQGFLSGSVLASALRGGLVPFPDFLRTPEFLWIIAAGAVLTELFVAIFLWSPSLRRMAFVMGAGFHLLTILFMAPTLELLVFSIEMLALYPLFRGATLEFGDLPSLDHKTSLVGGTTSKSTD